MATVVVLKPEPAGARETARATTGSWSAATPVDASGDRAALV
jgi:hypothetical protein